MWISFSEDVRFSWEYSRMAEGIWELLSERVTFPSSGLFTWATKFRIRLNVCCPSEGRSKISVPPILNANSVIFPSQLMATDQHKRTLVFHGQRVTWISPLTLKELLQLKSKFPKAPLVVGNTIVGNDSSNINGTSICFNKNSQKPCSFYFVILRESALRNSVSIHETA